MKHSVFILAFIAALTSGCISQRRINKICASCPSKTERHDSVSFVTNTVVRDSLIKLPADSAWYKLWLACDSSGRVLVTSSQTVNTDRTRIGFTLRDNTLQSTCYVDSALVAVRWLERHSLEHKASTNTITIDRPVPVQLSVFKTGLLWLGSLVFYLGLLLLILRGAVWLYYRYRSQ